MTLSTYIYILGEIDGPDLHAWVNKNLLRVENPKVTRLVEGEEYFYGWDKDKEMPQMASSHGIHNVLGQGFDAIFELDWWDAPHLYEGYEDFEGEMPKYYSEEEWEDDKVRHLERQKLIGEYYAEINFDTAYGFSRDGMGCTELHASYIVRLYKEYLEPRGIDIVWQNEYSGTYHKNLDQEGLTRFLGGGDDAMNWFRNIVVPVIEAEAAAEGGTVSWN